MKNKKKILIIENNANILYGLQAKFNVEGFETLVNEGSEPVEYILNQIKTTRPDYIILNMILPAIEGAEFLRILKSDEDMNKICVFAFAHLGDGKNQQATISDYYFIENEFIVDNFFNKVKQIMDNREKQEKF